MAQITYGSITVSDLTDGKNANIWTTTVAPTTPNYTFTISDLIGSDDAPREGDIILYNVYRYTIDSIDSTTVLAGNRQSLQGAAGTNGGKWYSGTGITGTSTTATIFNNSGVANAVVGDMYLNTSTNNTYRCTVAGTSSVAKWVYVNNIKGSQGSSVIKVETEYYRKLAGGQAPQSSTEGSTTIPEYVDGCTYYTRTVTYLSSGSPDKGQWLENTTLTTQIKNAYDAWIAAGAAEIKLKQFFPDTYGLIVTGEADAEVDQPSTYGYNTIMAPNYLGLRYNAINLAKLTTTESTPELQFYFPSFNGSTNTPVQGDKGLTLGTSGMNFYHAGSNTADATLNSNGLTIGNGSIVLGTTGGTTAGNVTLSNQNFTRSINGTSHNDLRFAIGSKFGVASDGTLYSSGLESIASRVESAVNMLLDSDAPSLDKVYASENRYWSDASVTAVTPSLVEISDPPVQGIAHAARFVCDGTNTSDVQRAHAFYRTNSNIIPLIVGQTYTATWWARCTNGSGKTRCQMSGKGGTVSFSSPIYDLTSEWEMFSFTATIAELNTNYKIWFYSRFPANTTGTVEICGCKLVVGDSIEEYKTQILQTADNVLIKATRDGASLDDQKAGGTSAAALINVAPDTVKIAANHVEITGTAVFNAVDADATAKAAMLNSEIEIGGKNILRGTDTMLSDTWLWVTGGWYKTGTGTTAWDVDITDSPVPLITKAVRATTTAANTYIGIAQGGVPLRGGKEITLSAWVKGTAGDKVHLRQAWATAVADGGTVPEDGGKAFTITESDKWIKYSYTKTIAYDHPIGDDTSRATNTFANGGYVRIQSATVGNSALITGIKMEYGNKATDWTPAEEDVQAEIDAKKSVHTLMSSSAGSTYANILTWTEEGRENTSWVINTTATPLTNVKIGDTCRVAYKVTDMNNAYVYVVGELTNISGSTVYMTMHGLDTTIIDGGNILTNSIGANQIKANAITANKIAIGDFNNYVTVTEKDANSILTSGDTIENGWLKTNAGYSAQCPRQPRWTTNGESYRITGTVKAPSAGCFMFVMYARNSNGSIANNSANYRKVLTANTETQIDTVITLNNSNYSTATLSDILVCFCTTTTWTENFQSGYIKNLKCERMSGGNLIVDGSITADKIAIGTNHELENILLDSDAPTMTKVEASADRYFSDSGSSKIVCSNFTLTDAPEEGWVYGRRFVYDGSVATNNYLRAYAFYNNANGIPLTPNKTYTATWWARCTSGSGRTNLLISEGNGATGTVSSPICVLTSYWKKYTYSFTFGSAVNTNYNRIWFRALFPASTAGTVEICGCKLVAGADAESYITRINDAGIRIHPSNTENHSVVINGSGLEIFKGGTTDQYSVAKYSDTARIGKTSAAHMELGASAISMSDATDKLLDISASTNNGNRQTDMVVSSSAYRGYTTYSAGSDYAYATTGVSTSGGSLMARIYMHKYSGYDPEISLRAIPSDTTNGAGASIQMTSASSYANASIKFDLTDRMMALYGNGDIDIRVNTSAASDSTDGKLYTALKALRWNTNAVISANMLDLKRWMGNVTQSLTPTCTNITLPYTPTKNGLLLVLLRANAAGRAYLSLSGTNPNIVDCYQAAGGYSLGVVFVTKDTQVKVASSSNLMSYNCNLVTLG